MLIAVDVDGGCWVFRLAEVGGWWRWIKRLPRIVFKQRLLWAPKICVNLHYQSIFFNVFYGLWFFRG